MGKVIAGKVSDIPPGKMIKIKVDGKDVMITNIEGDFCAMDDTCTHSGSSLSEGTLEGCIVTCGWHGAKFDCKTGKLDKFPAKINDLASYNVTVDSDNIFVEM